MKTNRVRPFSGIYPARALLGIAMGLLAGPLDGADATSRSPDAAARASARASLLGAVDDAWDLEPSPGVDAARVASRATTEPAAWLDGIRVPALSFTQAPLGAVVAALNEISSNGAASAAGGIVLVDPDGETPSITLSVRDVSLRRALELVGTAAGFDLSIQSDAAFLQAPGNRPLLSTESFPLGRAALQLLVSAGGLGAASLAEEAGAGRALRAMLQQAGVDFEGIPGSGAVYDGTRLLVTQTSGNLTRVGRILAPYFRPASQVEIEARFIEVQEGVLEEFGIAWNAARRGLVVLNPTTGAPLVDRHGRSVVVPQETYGTGGLNRSLAEAFNGAQSLNSILIDGEAAASTQPSRLPGSALLGSAAGPLAEITGWVGDIDVNAVIRALAQRQGSDLLSAPRLTVVSGQPASITVAQEMRYPQSYGQIQSQVGSTGNGSGNGGGSAGVTITAGTPQDFATRNVGVELRVTAHVEEDGRSITLDLNPKVTDFDGFMEYGGPSLAISAGTSVTVPPGFYQPIFSVREVTTRVSIGNGSTLIMGGLTREEAKKVDDHVPLLGRIPLVGRLFRSTGESTQKRSLLVFVTARLVSASGAPVAAPEATAPGEES